MKKFRRKIEFIKTFFSWLGSLGFAEGELEQTFMGWLYRDRIGFKTAWNYAKVIWFKD